MSHFCGKLNKTEMNVDREKKDTLTENWRQKKVVSKNPTRIKYQTLYNDVEHYVCLQMR